MERLLKMLSLGKDATTDDVVGKVAEAISAARDANARADVAEKNLAEATQKNADLEESLSAARAQIEETRKAGETAFIEEMVAAGRIAPHDDEAKEKARKLYAGAPEEAREMLLGGHAVSVSTETVLARRVSSSTDTSSVYELQAEEMKKFYPNA